MAVKTRDLTVAGAVKSSFAPLATGNFVIQELPVDGSPGERFVWGASTKPPANAPGVPGGARACPIQPWPLGGKQRTVRTDYPGAVEPSEQILGPSQKPFSLSGKFDDRYNTEGFAISEMRRFEGVCKRGNPVQFSYLSITRIGVITEWDFQYKREWHIEYKFEVSVHADPAAPVTSNRAPANIDSPSKNFDQTDTAIQFMMDANNVMPASQLGGGLADNVNSNLATLATSRDNLGSTLDNRELTPPENPVDAFTRLATQFREVRAGAYNMLLALAIVRSDVDVTTRTAMSVLNFEDWSRSLRYMARIAMGQAHKGDINTTERASPSATRLYRPHAGESLYAISRKFYGTPFGWRLIYERNALSTFKLSGTETLVIPERGGV